MHAQQHHESSEIPAQQGIAPRPKRLADTGLSMTLVADLIAKHLHEGGSLSMTDLVDRLALSGAIIESVIQFMKLEARVEVGRGSSDRHDLQYSLTDKGRSGALDALLRSGYVGPAPVPLADYAEVVRKQTVHNGWVTRGAIETAFEDLVIQPELRDRLGPSLNSGRAIFIYGPAGTGKTFITKKLTRLFGHETLIPHAIAINESIVPIFDPMLHKRIEEREDGPSLMLDEDHDPRFIMCERPVIIAGGELTADMLDIQYDASTRTFTAPLQLKANNGLFIIDDMGRQRISPEEVFNRWIIPLEEKLDYLTLGAGKHFNVPFDVILIFSTNLAPLDLADEAFLRRIGYKIKFDYLEPDAYSEIWRTECLDKGIVCEQGLLDFVINQLHRRRGVPLLPCHPRDLLGIAADKAEYEQKPRRIDTRLINWAWDNYFVTMNDNTHDLSDGHLKEAEHAET